jgi:signal peptide peptidase SppA
MRYDRILAHLAGAPWLIEPNAARQLAAILNRRMRDGGTPPEAVEEARAIAAARDQRKAKARPMNVAFVPLYGIMTQRADLFMEVSGLLSTDQLRQMIDDAAADPNVEAIVMDVDSPGGSVHGTEELARSVAAAAAKKKTFAVANSTAASAAYYVASQASELVVTPGGWVGSVGVVWMHVDESEALKLNGQVVTVVATSPKKAAGVDPGPLSPAGRQHMEEIVAGYYDQFVKAVARGRNVSQARVRGEFGDGGMVLADQAVKLGMADRVATLDEVLSRYGLSTADLTPVGEGPTAPSGRRKARSQARPAGSVGCRGPEASLTA